MPALVRHRCRMTRPAWTSTDLKATSEANFGRRSAQRPRVSSRSCRRTVRAARAAALRRPAKDSVRIGFGLECADRFDVAATSPDFEFARRLWIALAQPTDQAPNQRRFSGENQAAGDEHRSTERNRQRKKDRAPQHQQPAKNYGQGPPHVYPSPRKCLTVTMSDVLRHSCISGRPPQAELSLILRFTPQKSRNRVLTLSPTR